MQIGFPTQCMTVDQENSGDDQMPTKNLMMIAVFCQLLMFIGDPILLGVFKLGDELLVLSGLGSILTWKGVDGDFILDDNHECRLEILMGHREIFFRE